MNNKKTKIITKFYTILRDDKRYPPGDMQLERNPQLVLVKGTLKQAKHVAETLSSFEVGCDYYYYVIEGIE